MLHGRGNGREVGRGEGRIGRSGELRVLMESSFLAWNGDGKVVACVAKGHFLSTRLKLLLELVQHF